MAPTHGTTGTTDLRARIHENWTEFSALVARSERLVERGRLEAAAVSAQVAATFAWFNHPGVFAHAPLEAVLERIGHALPPDDRPPRGQATGRLRVLHVATHAYATGGHTQMLRNWIAGDPTHHHTIVFTDQGSRPVPDKVLGAAGTEHDVVRLDQAHRSLLGRARQLRSLVGDSTVVVLHVHPNDVVPWLALADAAARPVIHVNHADHVFWLGSSAATTVLCLRRSGRQLCVDRRGIAPGRTAIAIRPLVFRPRTMSRDEAKSQLGLDPDQVLLVTAAAGTKYEPIDGVGFLDLVEPVLRDNPGATLVAAGPAAEGRWRALQDQGLGRALGLLPDVHPLLEAADIYLDSYPFSSLTSLLEAGSLGAPTVILRPPTSEPNVLGADTPELEGCLVAAPDPRVYADELQRLIKDSGLRETTGRQTQDAIHAAHADDAFQVALNELMTAPARIEPGPLGEVPRSDGGLDQRVALLQAQTQLGQGRIGATALNAPHLPPLRRAVTRVLHGARALPWLPGGARS